MSLWRLVIVVFALTGFGAAVTRSGFANTLPTLSQQASLLTGIVYLGLLAYPVFTAGRSHEPRSPWLRGALTVLLLLVSLTFMLLMGGDLGETGSLFQHLLTPLVVAVDWVGVGRNQIRVKWWYPLSWLVFPLAYLMYFLAADLDLYRSFLDPDSSGFSGTLAGFLVAVTAAGYLLYGVGKVKAVIRAQGDEFPGQPRESPQQSGSPRQPAQQHDGQSGPQAVGQSKPQPNPSGHGPQLLQHHTSPREGTPRPPQS